MTKVLRNGSKQMFWKGNGKDFPIWFDGFVHLVSDKTNSSQKGSALVAFTVPVALRSICDM